jgi:hypothetical protein
MAAGLTLSLAGLPGCYGGLQQDRFAAGGDADDDGSGGVDDGAAERVCEGLPSVSARPLRRLSPLQYRNTVRELLGDPEFDPGYDDDAAVPTERGIRQLRSGVEAALERKAAWTQPVFPCDTAGAPDLACAETFIETFGTRAFRRPLTDDDRKWLLGVYQSALLDVEFADAMDVVFGTILQAPAFVYIIETGEPVEEAPAELRQLTDHELASRLSYLLWDTMPDAALLEAADAGELRTDDGLRTQVDRMLDDPRTEGKIQHVVSDWLQLDGGELHFSLEETAKDPELFPQYGPALQEAMRIELEAFVHRIIFEEDGSFERLLTDHHAYVNGPLAELYGIVGGPTGDEWAWVELDPQQRGGLLTRAAFLTVYGSAKVHSPIRRGVFVIEEMLCTGLGEPPPNASDIPVEGGEVEDDDGNTSVRSVRDDVDVRTQGDDCQACHRLINPVGFSFEHYDAIGGWQDEELISGLPIDATGDLPFSDVQGPLTDALDLSDRLATSTQVRECFADRWMTRALGQPPGPEDECARDWVLERFAETGSIRELLTTIVLSDAFRYMNTTGESE